VVALLALAEPAAHHDVRDRARLQPGVSLDHRTKRDRREVVGADALERALAGPPDGRAYGIDDHCFRHLLGSPSVDAVRGASLVDRVVAPLADRSRRRYSLTATTSPITGPDG